MTSSGLFQTTNPSKVGSTHNGKHSRLWEQVLFFKSDLILEGGGVAGGGGGGGGAKLTRHRKLFNPLALENKH